MAGVKGRSGGSNAKTRKQLEQQGTYRPDRHDGIENPAPLPGMPKPPAKLGRIARKEWRRCVQILDEQKRLSRDIASALYQYCQLFEDSENIAARRAERKKTIELMQDQLPDLDPDAKLEVISNITSLLHLDVKDETQIRQYRLAIRAYLVEFGLTPAARSRVKQIDDRPSTPTAPSSPFARLQGQAQAIRRVK